MMNEVPKKKILSVNFSRALFSLLDFLTLEAWTDRSTRNVSAELLLCTVYYLRRVQTSSDLMMQALVWLCMI